ncbi:hypothetical protein H6G06_00535 [Anabaena sphaerica FACHB-251]|uniref:Uncharacterized protein n=1 Tax=Anabaena sphaerica FACHB-251 TaxID=2692883 RepID=A0A926WF60_9NOST|nr:hypothetical protein [Anabaena sphaerica]MBD2292003.1 hypothetical protein [Anabaena sphaerica FACHB-251]
MTTVKKDPFQEWKFLNFWKKQSLDLIPLMTGLAVTGRMGIQGLAAIPVYILAADATRRVINFLEPEVVSAEKSQPIPDIDKKYNTEIAYTVVHKIPGRIRFNIPQISQDSSYAQRLESLLKVDNQVTNVRINSQAASIAIAYQSPEISISHWVEIMELALRANSSTNPISEIGITAINHPEVSPVASPEISNVWADLKPPSLSYSLGLMANLPV